MLGKKRSDVGMSNLSDAQFRLRDGYPLRK
jgi:hypothetical protein